MGGFLSRMDNLRSVVLAASLLTPQVAAAGQTEKMEIARAETSIRAQLLSSLNSGQGCEHAVFTENDLPTDSIPASGPTTGFHVFSSPIECPAENLCTTAAMAFENGKPLAATIVGALCALDANEATHTYRRFFFDSFSLGDMEPFDREVVRDSDGMALVNPHNYDRFMEMNAGKTVILMLTLENCGPCDAIKKGMKDANHGNYEFGLINIDNPRFTEPKNEEGKERQFTDEAESFVKRLGLPVVPFAFPVVVYKKGSSGWLVLPESEAETAVKRLKAL